MATILRTPPSSLEEGNIAVFLGLSPVTTKSQLI